MDTSALAQAMKASISEAEGISDRIVIGIQTPHGPMTFELLLQ